MDKEIIYLMEEIDRACDTLVEDHRELSFMSDDDLLEYFESTPFTKEIPMNIINECAVRYRTEQNLNEDVIQENAIMGALSALGSGLLAAGGAFSAVLAGPWGMLVTSLGLSAAMAIFKKIKRAAEKKDRDAVEAEIMKAQAEIAAAKNGGSGNAAPQTPADPSTQQAAPAPSQPQQQQKA